MSKAYEDVCSHDFALDDIPLVLEKVARTPEDGTRGIL
jgi:hypothetical protein